MTDDMNDRIRHAAGRWPVQRREPLDPDLARRLREHHVSLGEPIPPFLAEDAVHRANYGTTDSGLGPRGTPVSVEPSASESFNDEIRGRYHRSRGI